MLNLEQRELLHRYLILDLAIQSLQHDYKSLEQLKMGAIYLAFVDNLLKDIRQEYYNSKRLLTKDKIRVVKWIKVSEHFSDVVVATAGEDISMSYANQAIKTAVEQLLGGFTSKC